jgi:hypothetical protein
MGSYRMQIVVVCDLETPQKTPWQELGAEPQLKNRYIAM